MIEVRCRCGERYFADDSHSRHHIKCARCRRTLRIETTGRISSASSSPPITPRQVVTPGAWRSVFRRKANSICPRASWGLFLFSSAMASVLLIVLVMTRSSTREGSTPKAPARATTGARQADVDETRMPESEQVDKQFGGTPQTQSVSHLPPLGKEPSTLDNRRPASFRQLSVPAIPDPIPFSLPNGTWIIRPADISGHSRLRINNGTDLDAVVKFISATRPRKTVWMLYICSHNETAITNIAPRGYFLRFALGKDWDPASSKFLRDREFYQAGNQFDFVESEMQTHSGAQSIEYTEFEVTLNVVPNGNLPREPIDEQIFDGSDLAD